jgi:hypothetical protein
VERARFRVDFNELLEQNLVLLSREDTRLTSSGESVLLHEGLAIEVYDEDLDDEGGPDCLVASGIVERNVSSARWAQHVKWCCRIDSNGIQHESDLE